MRLQPRQLLIVYNLECMCMRLVLRLAEIDGSKSFWIHQSSTNAIVLSISKLFDKSQMKITYYLCEWANVSSSMSSLPSSSVAILRKLFACGIRWSTLASAHSLCPRILGCSCTTAQKKQRDKYTSTLLGAGVLWNPYKTIKYNCHVCLTLKYRWMFPHTHSVFQWSIRLSHVLFCCIVKIHV